MSSIKDNFTSLSATRIKEERTRLGFSQADISNLCGVSREMWGKYERGLSVPGGEVLFSFAVNGADIQYILTGNRLGSVQIIEPLSRREAALLDNYRNIEDEEDKSVVERTALMAAKASQGETKSRRKKAG